MNDFSWSLVSAVATAIATVGAYARWVSNAFAKRDAAISALQLELAGQKGKTDALSSSIAASEARMATALEGVRQDIHGMAIRLDRLLEAIMLERKNTGGISG